MARLNQTNGLSQTSGLSLYHYPSCPYCVMTRKVIGQLDLNVEQRDVIKQPKYRSELMAEGGKSQVPCLRIENEEGNVSWLYESADIIRYLRQHARTVA